MLKDYNGDNETLKKISEILKDANGNNNYTSDEKESLIKDILPSNPSDLINKINAIALKSINNTIMNRVSINNINNSIIDRRTDSTNNSNSSIRKKDTSTLELWSNKNRHPWRF